MDAFAVGVAQMAIMVPALLFLPLGGLVATAAIPAASLMRYHLFYACRRWRWRSCCRQAALSYPLLIAYGLGRSRSAPSPCRHAMPCCQLPAQGNLPRAVALATALQSGDSSGHGLRVGSRPLGAVPLLLLQAGLVLAGFLAVWRLPDPPQHPPAKHPGFWRSVGRGCVGSGEVRPDLAGAADQHWHRHILCRAVPDRFCRCWSATSMAAARAKSPRSTSPSGRAPSWRRSPSPAWRGGWRGAGGWSSRPSAWAWRSCLPWRVQPPFVVLIGLCFVWGLGAGITLTQGRTVVQIVSPPTHRARLMSLYQLGLGGGGPIGAFSPARWPPSGG